MPPRRPYIPRRRTPVGRAAELPKGTRSPSSDRRNLQSLSHLPPPRATETEARTPNKNKVRAFYFRCQKTSVDLLVGPRHLERAIADRHDAHLFYLDSERKQRLRTGRLFILLKQAHRIGHERVARRLWR